MKLSFCAAQGGFLKSVVELLDLGHLAADVKNRFMPFGKADAPDDEKQWCIAFLRITRVMEITHELGVPAPLLTMPQISRHFINQNQRLTPELYTIYEADLAYCQERFASLASSLEAVCRTLGLCTWAAPMPRLETLRSSTADRDAAAKRKR